MAKILIVDDEISIRRTFEIFLKREGHEIFLAPNVEEALEIVAKEPLDLIITDIIMPRVSGITLLKKIREKNDKIPVIIMTGEPTVETAKQAVTESAEDYLTKPVSKEILMRATNYALSKKELEDKKAILEKENIRYRENLEVLVDQRTLALQRAIKGTVSTIASIIEVKDPYTAGHEKRVANLAYAIAEKLGLSDEEKKKIYFTGYLHDIGKLLVPSEILSKPGRLTEGEFQVIKEHVKNGYDLTKDIELPWDISTTILQHHERLDGSGYPNGLKGDEIILEARILAVADVVEAMTSHRPYRPGLGIDFALDEIQRNSGITFDEKVVEVTIQLFTQDHYQFSDLTNHIEI